MLDNKLPNALNPVIIEVRARLHNLLKEQGMLLTRVEMRMNRANPANKRRVQRPSAYPRRKRAKNGAKGESRGAGWVDEGPSGESQDAGDDSSSFAGSETEPEG